MILEVHCLHGIGEQEENERIPEFCKRGVGKLGYHCMENKCAFMAFTDAPNEIAYSGNEGVIPDGDTLIGFGGDMEPHDYNKHEIDELKNMWEKICRNKIQEAYDEYMVLFKEKYGEQK
ncbi:hypothetical protein [Paenibacillus sp. SYP-B3998]|nr:hypothetical protein [Paenibacillus sp. SYP-B3998]